MNQAIGIIETIQNKEGLFDSPINLNKLVSLHRATQFALQIESCERKAWAFDSPASRSLCTHKQTFTKREAHFTKSSIPFIQNYEKRS